MWWYLAQIKEWSNSFISLFFPRSCLVCNKPLSKSEECMCARCNIDLPRTDYHLWKENPIEQMFWGKIPLVRATSYFYYRKGSDYCHILYQLKYEGQKEIGEIMGRYIAMEILSSGFFQGIDVIIPVPLHKKKQKLRGYNQSEWIARGVSAITAIPIETSAMVRIKNTETQTRKSAVERWENVDGIFCLLSPESYVGKHILIIDDVLTTGATTVACASPFNAVKDARVSILTLAITE